MINEKFNKDQEVKHDLRRILVKKIMKTALSKKVSIRQKMESVS